MRHFSYFLFENFDLDAPHPADPRRFLNADADAPLSFVADQTGTVDRSQIDTLVSGGILRWEQGRLWFDTPIFLHEDAAALHCGIAAAAERLTDVLEPCLPQLRRACDALVSRFPAQAHLYHILCGMVFDGSFFDVLEQRGAVTTSRVHDSGLDYLAVIYETHPALDAYANGLLCSYNRFANDHCALQTFGDACGHRLDFYRFFRLLEAESLPDRFQPALQLYHACGAPSRDEILQQVSTLCTHGSCDPSVLALLELFGYARDGALCVPVYTEADRPVIADIAHTVEVQLGDAFAAELAALSAQLDITAARHRVAPGEIANELYHLLFGAVNETLVRKGIVAAPPELPGEGRYLRCIQLMAL